MNFLTALRKGVILTCLWLTYLSSLAQDSIFQKMYYDDGSESHIYSQKILPRPDGGIFRLFRTNVFPAYSGSVWNAYRPDGIITTRGGYNHWVSPSFWPPFVSGYEVNYNHVAETDTNKFVFVGAYRSGHPSFPPLVWTPYIELQTWTGPTTSTSVARSLNIPGEVTYVHKTPDNHLLFAVSTTAATFLVKTDLLLNTVWGKKLGLPPYDWRIRTNAAGDIYLIYAANVVKLKSTGDLIWQKTLPGILSSDEFVYNDGGLILAGGDSITPPVLARMDSSGAVLWAKGWPMNSDRPFVAPCTGDPGFFLQHGDTGLVSKVDGNGNFIWNRYYETPGITNTPYTGGGWSHKRAEGIQPAPNKGFWAQWGFVNEMAYHVTGFFLFKADSTGYSGCDTTLHPFVTTPLTIVPATSAFPITDTLFSFVSLSDLTNSGYYPPLMDVCAYTCTAPAATVSAPGCGNTVTANIGPVPPAFYQWKVNAAFPVTNVPTITRTLAPGWNTIRLTWQTGVCIDTLYFLRYVASLTPANLGPDVSICPGDSITLTPGAGYATYTWAGSGITTPSRTVSAPGTYICTVADTSGCTDSDTVVVSLHPGLPSSLPTADTICAGESLILNAGTWTTVNWSTGASTPSITVSAAGSYSVTVTNAAGCVFTRTTAVSSIPVTPVDVPDFVTLCFSPEVVTASPGYTSYLWSTGSASAAITVSAAGTYIVTATDSSGCTSRDTATVITTLAPAVSLPLTGVLCPGDSILLSAPSGYSSYLWSTGAVTADITVGAVGTYSITVTDAWGCTSSDSTTVTATTTPPVSLPPTLTFPSGGSGVLDAGPGYAAYLWSTGAITSAITVTSAGTYSVTVTDSLGCESSASTLVTTLAPPPSAAFSYSGGFPTLDFTSLSTDYDTLLWDFGDGATSSMVNPTHTFPTAGTFTVCLIASSTVGADTACEPILLTSVSAGSGAGFSVSPNPFSESFEVHSPAEFTGYGWRVFSAEGKEVRRGILMGTATQISLAGEPAGIYFLRVSTSTGESSYKVIKQ